ncbi:unnamed protein product [Callosobruchus maculatus]|uniref:Uncharacterized protein n=1 Tax=Callosobruchus maculatus TaxID=64391 RepID=A0A653CPZ8_CALMS|nr:unnamed protein product [Callosobruchus maculatus]
MQNEYPNPTSKALRIYIPFAMSYLYEAGFSAVAVIKKKYRSWINEEQEMRVAVSNFIPRFEKLCGDHQAQSSHSFDCRILFLFFWSLSFCFLFQF